MTLPSFFDDVKAACMKHIVAKYSADPAYKPRIEESLRVLVLCAGNFAVFTPTDIANLWNLIRKDADLLNLMSFVTGYVLASMGTQQTKEIIDAVADALVAFTPTKSHLGAKEQIYTDEAYVNALPAKTVWVDCLTKNKWLLVAYVLSNDNLSHGYVSDVGEYAIPATD